MEAKTAQLGLLAPLPVETGPGRASCEAAPFIELRLIVKNPLGLHARPAARFVRTVGRFVHAEVQVSNLTAGRGPVNAKSHTRVLALGIAQNHTILVAASGPDAHAAA